MSEKLPRMTAEEVIKVLEHRKKRDIAVGGKG